MKYFIDTHDKTKGSFPAQELTEEEFFAQFDALEVAAAKVGAFGHAAHVNLKEGKAFCFMCGPDEEFHPQGACGDRPALRLHHRGPPRHRRRHARPASGSAPEAEDRVAPSAAGSPLLSGVRGRQAWALCLALTPGLLLVIARANTHARPVRATRGIYAEYPRRHLYRAR